MIRFINPDKAHSFIPKSEMDEVNPLTIWARPMTSGQAMTFQYGISDAKENRLAQFRNVCDVIGMQVDKIENFDNDGARRTLEGAAGAKEFIHCCGGDFGIELLFEIMTFIQEISNPTKAEAGN